VTREKRRKIKLLVISGKRGMLRSQWTAEQVDKRFYSEKLQQTIGDWGRSK